MNTETVLVQVKFTMQDPGEPSYTDALYFTQQEYAKLRKADKDAMKRSRYDEWKDKVKNPPPVELPENMPEAANEEVANGNTV